jgi:nitroreductase
VAGAAFVVAIATTGGGPTSFDAGRAAQNMLLAAWNEGVGSCPNGFPDRDAAARILGVGADEDILIVLTFGYPTQKRDPQRRTPEEWSARAARKSLDELVTRI